jgi:hypothetical protein
VAPVEPIRAFLKRKPVNKMTADNQTSDQTTVNPDSANENKRLRDALAELESACENLAATRTARTYHSIVQDGAEDLLLVLHQARVKARAALGGQSDHTPRRR